MKKEDLILAIAFAIATILFLWYIFGKSPTLEQVILGATLLNSGWIYSMNSKFREHIGEHRGYSKAKHSSE
ncbi:MAG: hypothetical protein KJ697_02645 [Nanoarchaeota archaeon]|nr:hypothetical protein [Nanoarchaeota archaeon]MBU4124446.1 hypothetical protein [Nanoarchaeota archaeon]